MTSTIQVRIDDSLRRDADRVFADIGMDTNAAIRLFLRQAVIRRTFPFEVISSDPFYHPVNQAHISRAIADYENGAQNYHEHDLIEVAEEPTAPKTNTGKKVKRAKALV